MGRSSRFGQCHRSLVLQPQSIWLPWTSRSRSRFFGSHGDSPGGITNAPCGDQRACRGTVGAVLGLLSALLITLVVSRTTEPEPTKTFFEFTSLFALGYLGLVVGSRKGQDFRHVPLPGSVAIPATPPDAP